MEFIVIILIVLSAFIALKFFTAKASYKSGTSNPLVRKLQLGLAVVGLLILIGLGFGTSMHLKQFYFDLDDELKIAVPSMPLVESPKRDRRVYTKPFEKGRLLLHTIAVDEMQNSLGYAEANIINWPEDKDKEFKQIVNLKGVEYTITRIFSDAKWSDHSYRDGSNRDGYVLRAKGHYKCRYKNGSSGGSIRCSEEGQQIFDRSLPVYGVNRTPGGTPIYSMAPTSTNAHVRFIHFMVPIRAEDKLKSQPLSEFISDRSRQIEMLGKEGSSYYSSINRFNATPRPILLIGQIGGSALLLLIAVTLITLPFGRRKWGIVSTVTLLTLYVVTVDYMSTSYHLDKLENPNSKSLVRVFAAKNANQTFFHHGLKRDRFKEILSQDNLPIKVRDEIHFAAANCQEPEIYDYKNLYQPVIGMLLKMPTLRNHETLKAIEKNHPAFLWLKEENIALYFDHMEPKNGRPRNVETIYLNEGQRHPHLSRRLFSSNIRVESLQRNGASYELKYEIDKEAAQRWKVDAAGVQTAALSKSDVFLLFKYPDGEDQLARFLVERS